MVELVMNRLGTPEFGSSDLTGNLLTYPRRIILSVLRDLFTQTDLFTPLGADGSDTQRNPFLLVYESDGVSIDKTSRIVLADFASEHLIKTEARPRIIVERGSGSFGGSRPSTQNYSGFGEFPGSRSFVANFSSTIAIRCVSRVRLESEMLAAIVSMCLTFFNREIMAGSHLAHIDLPSIGGLTLEKSSNEAEQWSCLVTLTVFQPVAWSNMNINTQVLDRICATIALRAEE